MANTDTPNGFKPVSHASGGQIVGREYRVADGQSIYKGDPVSINVLGEVIVSTAGDGQKCIGVAAESVVSAVSENLLVWDDPNIIYEVQGASSGAHAASDVGCLADHTATGSSHAVNATLKLSTAELSAVTGHIKGLGEDPATAQFMILGKVDRPGNAWGDNVKMLVRFYEHAFLALPSS